MPRIARGGCASRLRSRDFRLLPGVLCDEDSAKDDSFSAGLLEYPPYTRPKDFRGMRVPEILLSGDHAKITQWCQQQAFERTRKWRPDLLDGR